MPNRVNFDISKLPDRALNLLIRGAEEGQRLEAAVPAAVHGALLAELARRYGNSDHDTGQDPIRVILPSLSHAEAHESRLNLMRDITEIDQAASLAILGGEVREAEELSDAAEFLFKIWEACIPPGGNAKLIPLQ